jgi:hypothetical protein
MNPDDETPDWDQPISLSLTPGDLINALFPTANSVHTGWASCLDSSLITADLSAMDERTGNYVRLAEQEFADEESADVVWHDWSVEIRLADVLITGHWQIQVTAPPLDWEWCARESEAAFEKAAVLAGRRLKRTLSVDEGLDAAPPPRPQHH